MSKIDTEDKGRRSQSPQADLSLTLDRCQPIVAAVSYFEGVIVIEPAWSGVRLPHCHVVEAFSNVGPAGQRVAAAVLFALIAFDVGRAAAEVGSAEVEGAALGSKALTFVPGKIRSGEFRFAIGTAGSGTLVLQTILPALIIAAGPSQIEIEGGTHNPAAPPFDFLQRSFVPLIERMGPKVKLELERYGFYPAGGGRIVVEITPTDVLKPINLEERGVITTKRATALVANLPYHIARRELDTVGKLLNWDSESLRCEDTKNSVSPGNLVMIEVQSSNVTEIFTSLGKLGVSAEDVARDAAEQASAYLHSPATVDEHPADQLLLPLALAGGGSFSAVSLNMHAKTNMEVIRQFLPVSFHVSEVEGRNRVSVSTGTPGPDVR